MTFFKAKRNIAIPLLIIFTAFAARFALLCFDYGSIPVGGDSLDYLAIAESLKEGNGFSLNGQDPTATRMPLYPLFLAGILSLPGGGVRMVQFSQIFIDSLTCLLLYFLARLLLGKTQGTVCGMFMALYVPLAFRCHYILSETLFTFFLVGSVLLLGIKGSHIWFSAMAGLLIGIGTLVRPNGLIVAVFLLLYILYRYGWHKSFRHSAAFLLFLALVLAPWVIRNFTVFHRFIPTFTITGITFYNSYFIPEKGFGYNEIKKEHNEYFLIDNEADKSSFLTCLTLQHIKRHPWQALKLIPMKLSLLIYPFDMKWLHPGFLFRYNVFWGFISILAVLALIGQTSCVRDRLPLVIFPIGALLLTSIIFYGSPRMRAPFDPLIAILASVAVLWIWRKRRRWLWIGTIVGLNAVIMFLGESTNIIELFKGAKPW